MQSETKTQPTLTNYMNRNTDCENNKQSTNTDANSNEENDINLLSGNNKVGVEIEPDVKSNNVYIQICSFSFILNCFSK